MVTWQGSRRWERERGLPLASRMSPSHGARCSSSSGGGSIGQWGGVEFIVEKVQSDTVEIVVTDFGCDIGFYIGWDDGLSDVFAAEAPSAIAADEAVVVGELVGVPAKRSYSQVGFVWGGGSGGGGPAVRSHPVPPGTIHTLSGMYRVSSTVVCIATLTIMCDLFLHSGYLYTSFFFLEIQVPYTTS